MSKTSRYCNNVNRYARSQQPLDCRFLFFRFSLFLGCIQTVLQITVGLEAVLILSTFCRSKLGNLSHLEQTVEYFITKCCRSVGKLCKILQGINPLVVKSDKLVLCLVEIGHLYIYDLQLVVEDLFCSGVAELDLMTDFLLVEGFLLHVVVDQGNGIYRI